MSHLVLVRHGTSEWNKLGLWTGSTDVALADEGIKEAEGVGGLLQDIPFDEAHVSAMLRAQETLRHITNKLRVELPTTSHEALNERHYGIHQGKNKWEVRDRVGEEEFQKICRSWNHPIPEGESLKQVSDRVVPYFESVIRPSLENDKNVIVVAHGNSLRALMKHIENIPDDDVGNLEMNCDEAHCYLLNQDGTFKKEVRRIETII